MKLVFKALFRQWEKLAIDLPHMADFFFCAAKGKHNGAATTVQASTADGAIGL